MDFLFREDTLHVKSAGCGLEKEALLPASCGCEDDDDGGGEDPPATGYKYCCCIYKRGITPSLMEDEVKNCWPTECGGSPCHLASVQEAKDLEVLRNWNLDDFVVGGQYNDDVDYYYWTGGSTFPTDLVEPITPANCGGFGCLQAKSDWVNDAFTQLSFHDFCCFDFSDNYLIKVSLDTFMPACGFDVRGCKDIYNAQE